MAVGVRHNLLAGLANTIWSALIGLAAVPIFLEYLGIEAYGLIGFFATTQALLQLLDVGVSPTINREIARATSTGELGAARNLLHTLASFYWCLAALLGLSIFAAAPSISQHWLQSNNLPEATITQAIMLMGLIVACRWPVGLYVGALNGAQRITVSSTINLVMITLSNIGAVAVLAFVSPTIQAFFLWQALVGLVHALTIRHAAWRVLGRPTSVRFELLTAKRVWRFSLGMSAIALSSILFSQLDKILLSRLLGLADFGHYMLATLVANSLYMLVIPFYNVLYPRFSALVATGNPEALEQLYRFGTRCLATLLFPAAMVLIVFSRDLVSIWTGNTEVATAVAPIVSLLAAGSAIHGVMYFPFALQLAHGLTKLPLVINLVLTVVLLPLIICLTMLYGPLGAAFSWLLLHILYAVFGTWMTHRFLLKRIRNKWLTQDVGIPLFVTLLVGLSGQMLLPEGQDLNYVRILCAATMALLAIALSFVLSPHFRSDLESAIAMLPYKRN